MAKQLTAKQQEALDQQILYEGCRRYLRYFLVHDAGGKWVSGKHLDLLIDNLQKIEKGDIKRLIVSMPPRHGKSFTISEGFPAWYIGKHPDDEMIISSYSIDLARDFSKSARDKIKKHKEMFRLEIDKSNQSAESWGIEGHRGRMTAAGVGGGITGKGARVAIIDDPVKNAEEAASETIRESIWNWYLTTLYTRLTPDGRIVIVMTRWHEDDLVGRLLRQEEEQIAAGTHTGEKWTVLKFPAIAEDDDILGRKEGDPLWPEYGFNVNRLNEIKVSSIKTWNALYQQRPSAQEGNMLRRDLWKYYDKRPENLDFVLQSWDMTFKVSDGSDFVSGQVWGCRGADVFLLDRVKKRMDINESINEVIRMSKKWPQALLKLVEDKANGPAVMSILKHKIPGLVPVNPGTLQKVGSLGKIGRVNAVLPIIESGNTYLPNANIAPWVVDFVDECANFPNGKHDDDVDSMSMALQRFVFTIFPQGVTSSGNSDYDDDDDDLDRDETTIYCL